MDIKCKSKLDYLSLLQFASNPMFHAHTKHIEVDYHFVREKMLRRDLQIKYIATGDQLANVFTKSLSTSRFHFLRSKIIVSLNPMDLRGDVKVSEQDTQTKKTVKIEEEDSNG